MTTLFRKTRVTVNFADRVTPQMFLAVLLYVTPLAFLGCSDDTSSPPPIFPSSLLQSSTSEAEIPEVDSDELRTLVATAEKPVLVEFSVLSGCYRCDDMRSPIRRKAVDMQQHADVVRIDFNLNRSLAQEVGATVCPSYVVYSQGKVVSVRTWPTSADFVADDVAAAASRANGSHGAVP